jgi:hypothetical protein
MDGSHGVEQGLALGPLRTRAQEAAACCGGQAWSAYEQNTQQSPGSGFKSVWQPSQR